MTSSGNAWEAVKKLQTSNSVVGDGRSRCRLSLEVGRDLGKPFNSRTS